MTQLTLDGQKLTRIAELESKRDILFRDMMQKIRLRDIHVIESIKKFRNDVKEIDKELHKLDGRRI